MHMKGDEIDYVESDNTGDSSFGGFQARACLRGRSIKAWLQGEERLNYPMRRVAGTKRGDGQYERISWDEALDTIASEFTRIRDTYGNEAIFIQECSGVEQNIMMNNPFFRLFNLLGGEITRYGSYSSAAISFGANPYTYGGGWGKHPLKSVKPDSLVVLVISGLIASATHLGTPANALYVLTGFGRSPLSNEVVVVVGFLAVGGVYWMLSFRDDVPRGVQKAALVVVTVTGLVAVAAISAAYTVGTVPTWSLPTAPASLWLGAMAPGAAVGLFALLAAGLPAPRRFAVAVAAVAGVASVADGVVLGLQWHLLGGIQTTVQSAQALVPFLPAVAVGYPLVCLTALAVVAIVAVRADGSRATGIRGFASDGARHPGGQMDSESRLTHAGAGAVDGPAPEATAAKPLSAARIATCVSGILLLAACFAVRFCFYAMYMTAGV